jgi:hypothetical protein
MRRFLSTSKVYVLAVPLLLTLLGTGSNQLVLVANHDRFPVMWNDYKVTQYVLTLEETMAGRDQKAALQARFDKIALLQQGFIDDTHVVMSRHTHLNFLADWLDFHSGTYSPGDMAIWLGSAITGYAYFLWAILMIGDVWKNKCLSTK